MVKGAANIVANIPEIGYMAADSVNEITDMTTGYRLYDGSMSQVGKNGPMTGSQLGQFYVETGASIITAGVYDQGKTLYEYGTGQITVDEASQRIGGTAVFQLLPAVFKYGNKYLLKNGSGSTPASVLDDVPTTLADDVPVTVAKGPCYTPKGPMLNKRIGHTFKTHGSHNTNELLMRAKGKGKAVGQWIDDVAAESFIADHLKELSQGAKDINLPKGLGRVIHPDGTMTPATKARLVPSKTGVKSAYPIP